MGADSLITLLTNFVSASPENATMWKILAGVGTLSGGGIAWILTQLKTAKEIENLHAKTEKYEQEKTKLAEEAEKFKSESIKLATENLKLKGDLLKTKNELENNHKESCKAVSVLIEKLKDAILKSRSKNAKKNSGNKIASIRQTLCDHITTGVLHDFKQLVEVKVLTTTNKEKYLNDFVFPELEKYCGWVGIINHPSFDGASPLSISSHYFFEIDELLGDLTTEKTSMQIRLTDIKSKLCLL